jgi:hypothetical protein
VLVVGFYGKLRPAVEQLLLANPDAMHLPMSMFAGRPITLRTFAHVASAGGLSIAKHVRAALVKQPVHG